MYVAVACTAAARAQLNPAGQQAARRHEADEVVCAAPCLEIETLLSYLASRARKQCLSSIMCEIDKALNAAPMLAPLTSLLLGGFRLPARVSNAVLGDDKDGNVLHISSYHPLTQGSL